MENSTLTDYQREEEEVNNLNGVLQLAFMLASRLNYDDGEKPSIHFLSKTEIQTVDKEGDMPTNRTTRYVMPLATDLSHILEWALTTLKEQYEKDLMYEQELPKEYQNWQQMDGHVYACAKRVKDLLWPQQ